MSAAVAQCDQSVGSAFCKYELGIEHTITFRAKLLFKSAAVEYANCCEAVKTDLR
jgi:hypothetical protein